MASGFLRLSWKMVGTFFSAMKAASSSISLAEISDSEETKSVARISMS